MAARHELSGVLIISPQKSGEKLSAMLDRQIYDPVVAVQTAGEARRLMSSGELDSGDGFEIVYADLKIRICKKYLQKGRFIWERENFSKDHLPAYPQQQ